MDGPSKKQLGIALVATAVFAGTAFVAGASRRSARDALSSAANAARDRLVLQIREEDDHLRNAVQTALVVPELRAAVGARVDTATFRDLFADEDWWAPYRKLSCVLTVPGAESVVRGELGAALSAWSPSPSETSGDGVTIAHAAVNETLVVFARDRHTGAEAFDLSFGWPFKPSVKDGGVAVIRSGQVQSYDGLDALRAVAAQLKNSDHAEVDSDLRWAAARADFSPEVAIWILVPSTAQFIVPAVFGVGSWVLAALSGGLVVLGIVRRKPAPVADLVSVSNLPPVRTSSVRSTHTPSPVSSISKPDAATMMSAGQGQVFGRYTLLERIGEGGMSELFTAVLSGAEGFERRFVIKRLRPHLALDPAAVSQFIDEAKFASQLVHSNIVPVFDFGKFGSGYYLAQEHIVGRNLAQVIQQHANCRATGMDPGLVCYIANEVLSGLAYAHQARDRDGNPMNIVHRDISPMNVMSSFDGEIKLLDFGIAKAETRHASTDPGNVKGNAAYMSPEQARGRNVDRRSDLFSLALVMFDLMTAERFYQGGSTAEVLYQAATGPTADHLARMATLPREIAVVLQTALSLEPDARFPDAASFSAQLLPHITRSKTHMATLMHELFDDDLAS